MCRFMQQGRSTLGQSLKVGFAAKAMSASENWTITMIELPGVIEGGMPGKNGQRKPGTTRGSPRRSRTAKASRISRPAVKSRCACEWGGWGRLSDDGPGQHNPGRSEGPWSRATKVARMVVFDRAGGLRLRTGDPCCCERARRMEANLTTRRACWEQA